jgi:hypothetical protein
MAFPATGFAAEAVAGAVEGIPDMLGMAVASGDGGPDVPAKPAGWCGLAGVMVASAELPPLAPQAAASMVPAAPAAAPAHQRRE